MIAVINRRRFFPDNRQAAMSLTSPELARYARHLALREIGVEGQEKLKAARVLVIGAGGLGSPSALYLAASGVGVVGVIDNDHVEISNLQRQVLYDCNSVGQPKAAIAAQRLRALNPETESVAHQVELRAANVREIFSGYDVVLDGTDCFTTRYLSNDACVMMRKPLVAAAVHRFEGQAMTYVPDRGPCYRCLFPEPPADELAPNCAEAGVLGVLPGVMGTIQATEAIKLIVGAGELLIGRLLTYDALRMRFEEFRFARRNDCAACGDHPMITALQDLAGLCSAESLANVRRLSASELKFLLSTSGDVSMIDVREPREFAVAHLPGAMNLPVGEIQQRLAELPRAGAVVFICRSGARSLTASAIAAHSGATRLAHLQGGLLAWARDIEGTFEVAPAG